MPYVYHLPTYHIPSCAVQPPTYGICSVYLPTPYCMEGGGRQFHLTQFLPVPSLIRFTSYLLFCLPCLPNHIAHPLLLPATAACLPLCYLLTCLPCGPPLFPALRYLLLPYCLLTLQPCLYHLPACSTRHTPLTAAHIPALPT